MTDSGGSTLTRTGLWRRRDRATRQAKAYGDMGRYGTILNPFPPLTAAEASNAPEPRFEAARPLEVKLGDGERLASRLISRANLPWPAGFARIGAAVAAFDADGDGQARHLPRGRRYRTHRRHDALLINKGDGRFADASAAFGLPKNRSSLGVAAADFDADRHIDLFLTGVGENRLLRNVGGKKFEDISRALGPMGGRSLTLGAVARPRSGWGP